MITVATHRLNIGSKALDRMATMVDGNGMNSCSAVWNKCITLSDDELVIICNEKARPRLHDLGRMLHLLEEGYGIVGLYRFGFFGFYKALIQKVGWFDERYVGGWNEDNDMILRLKEANIAYWEGEEIEYIQMPSSWHHEQAINHYQMKWSPVSGRLMEEETYRYELGTFKEREFLPWSSSVLMPNSGGWLDGLYKM